MGEENVCRLCFNLLNDIDYHLKEAQEKTDEITAKFLDKEKDPLRYNPELKLLDPRRGSRKEKTRGGGIKQQQQISPSLVTIQTEKGPASVRPRSPSHVPVKVSFLASNIVTFFSSMLRVVERDRVSLKVLRG